MTLSNVDDSASETVTSSPSHDVQHGDNVLVIRNLHHEFYSPGAFLSRPEPIRAVDNVSFSIPRGSCFALVGESGSGKSTVARLCVGLLHPSRGQVLLDGDDITNYNPRQLRKVRRRIQLVLQDPHASLDPHMCIEAVLIEALQVHSLYPERSARRQRVCDVIRQVGLDHTHLRRFPRELSGGQRQRVAIARAILCEPEILVLDEPVSALDVSIQAQIINLLLSLQQSLGLTYLFITHDLALVGQIADFVGVMNKGQLVESGSALQVCRSPRHSYTRKLLQAATGSPPLEIL